MCNVELSKRTVVAPPQKKQTYREGPNLTSPQQIQILKFVFFFFGRNEIGLCGTVKYLQKHN